jgi:hypothetical protein
MENGARITFLLVRGDGARFLRLTFRRRVLWAGLGFLGLAVSTLGAISGDYVSLRRQLPEVHALQRQTTGQQASIDSSRRRIAEARDEISSWRALHGKIWEPLGPQVGPALKGTGVGGGEPVAPFPDDRVASDQELDLLFSAVKDERENLRALERLIQKARPVLAARLAERR